MHLKFTTTVTDMMERIKYILNILIVTLLFLSVAIQKDERILGNDVSTLLQQEADSDQEIEVPAEETLADGTRVINSTSLAKDVVGFGGRTPVLIYVKDDIIQKIVAQPNAETPSFFQEVEKSGLLSKWDGMSLSAAATASVDGVSGATYSAEAIISNVKRAAAYGANVEEAGNNFFANLKLKDIIGLLVVLLGAMITLMKVKDKRLITIQMILNVIVLGFWCGSFLSLTTFVSWAANGVNLSLSLITITMFVIILIMPLFNRKGSYCHIHCPMGSAQELLAKVPTKKWKLSPPVAKFLNNLRYYILTILLFLMWLGVGFELINYEIFSAFIFNSASTVVLIMAAVFLILSLFITKPYCRFVCPTGALLTMSQKTHEK